MLTQVRRFALFSGIVFHIGLAEKYMQRSHEKALAMTKLMSF